MPSIQEIERFKQVLNELGGEPEILAARSEEIEDVPLPGEGPAEDLSELLQFTAPDEGPQAGEVGAPAESEAESGPASGDAGELSDLDFESLFGPELAGEGLDDIGDPSGGSGAGSPEEAGPLDFELPEALGDGDGFGDEAGEGFDVEEAIAVEAGEGDGAEAEAAADFGGFDLPEEFDLPQDFQVLPDETPDAPLAEATAPEGLAQEAIAPEADFPDLADLDLPGVEPVEEVGVEPEPAGPPAAGAEGLAGLEDEGLPPGGFEGDDFQIDEFVLPEAEEEAALAAGPAAAELAETGAAGGAEEIELSEQDFAAMRRTMGGLPRNLKIIIEELIGVKELSGEPLRALVGLLVAGAAPAAVAAQVSRITGKKIVLPAAFQKQSGLAFEEERGTFAYAFRQNILPLLRAFTLATLLLAVLGYAGYRFVYEPLRAHRLYRQGYSLLKAESHQAANRSFEQATRVWPIKGWYYRYAEGFIEARQFLLAEQKYEDLLKRYPGDRRGLLAFAGFESRLNGNYARADALLDEVLEADYKDAEALLLKGDNFLEWSDQRQGGPQWAETLEKARRHYALIMDYHGPRDEALFRMLRYFVRADKLKEALDLRRALDARPRLRADPLAYAELGGYLLDRQQTDEAGDTLRRALQADPGFPDTHYHLARYYNRLQKPAQEKPALEAVIGLLRQADPWTRARRETMLIDAHNRLGRLHWNGREYLKAEEQYNTAVGMIRGGQESGRLGLSPMFGEAFHNLGDIYYYVDRGWESALELYREASRNGYWSAAMGYKMGYAEYAGGRYDQALLEFSRVAEEQPENPNLLFALANTLYLRGHHFAAEGHYLHLLSLLEGRRGRIPSLRPEINPDHRALVENTMQAYNNLGVTLSRLAEQPRNPDKESQALAYFTFSSEFFDVLSRDPQTMSRADTRNLAFLNQRGMLYPQSGFELQIYRRIPLDLSEPRFRE